MIYFGGDSFMYGEGLEDKEDFPYLVSTELKQPYVDDSQVTSSNRLIYLRALNNLLSDEPCDFYIIMWSRGFDRRFEHIIDENLDERWTNIVPSPFHQKEDKIRNEISKFVMENLVTSESSYLNSLIDMISLQQLFKQHNKKYIFCFAHDEFLKFHDKYYKKKEFNLKIKDDSKGFTKVNNLKPIVDSIDFDNVVTKSFSEHMGTWVNGKDNIPPNAEQVKDFVNYFFEKIGEN